MKLQVRLVNIAAVINCVFALAAVIYVANWLDGKIADKRVKDKSEEEWKRNHSTNGRIIPKHAVGSLTVSTPLTGGGAFLTTSSRLINMSGGSSPAFGDRVELKTDEELQVFNQWYYHTGANGTEYWTHNTKNELPDPDGNYGRHFEVSQEEYIWMMQWKFRQQQEKK